MNFASLATAAVLSISMLSTTALTQASELPSFATDGKITFCTDATFPPMEFFEKTGDKTPVGFDIDLMIAIGEHWKVQPEIVTMDFTGLLPSLEAGRCDAVISGMFVTAERTQKFDAAPYISTNSVLVAKAGTPEIKSLDELASKTIAVQSGTDFVPWFEKINTDLKAKGLAETNTQHYPKASDGIQQVLIGRSFATTTQDTEVAYRNVQNPGSLSVIHTFADAQKFGFYMRREGNDLKSVSEAIAALKANGTLAGIIEKWKLSPSQLELPN